jgi:hypothetical protein
MLRGPASGSQVFPRACSNPRRVIDLRGRRRRTLGTVDDERHRLDKELEAAIDRAAKVRHALRFSPSPRNPGPDDPIVLAEAEVEAAREAVRTLDELDEGGSSRN